MALADEQKSTIIKKFRRKDTDTGSPEVQVALLTGNINSLTEHFKAHPKDNHSRLGLLHMVSQRKRQLAYLKRCSVERYVTLINALGLRK